MSKAPLGITQSLPDAPHAASACELNRSLPTSLVHCAMVSSKRKLSFGSVFGVKDSELLGRNRRADILPSKRGGLQLCSDCSE